MSRRLLLPLAAVVVVLDQASKHWAVNSLSGGRTIHVVWTLRLALGFNSGMAFSRGTGLGPVIGVIATIAVAWLLLSLRKAGSRLSAVGMALVGGGAAGNVVDRFFRGEGWLRGSVVEGIWLGIIGAFILQNARTSADAVGVASRLARGRVRDVLEPPPVSVPADIPLSEALDRFLRGHEGDAFPVVDGGRLIGMISLASASEIGAVDPLRPVRDALIPLDDFLVVHPDEPLDEVGARLSTTGTALVVDGDDLVGTISGPRVLAWARSGGVGGRE